MNKEVQAVLETIKELKNSDIEALAGLLDWYFESDCGCVWYTSSGMAYDGDSENAIYIGQTENGNPVNF